MWQACPRIAERDAGRKNNFNLLRMLAATGVLVSHAYPISLGSGTPEPLQSMLRGTALGTVCVMVFFAISGFFIARSFSQKRSLGGFLSARALRLFPALSVILALTVMVGLFLTTAPTSKFWPAAADYYLRNITLFFLRYDLPGVFETNPFGPAINGSLWTLNYEVLCYLGVVFCGLAGILARPSRFASMLVVFLLVYGMVDIFGAHVRIEKLMQLALPFAIGMAFWVWRAQVILSWRLVGMMVVLTAILWSTPIFPAALVLALSYTVFVIGFARIPLIERYCRVGDYSYGTYVYAFPIQQLVAATGVISPLVNIALALPATLICAVLSWHLIEAPALSLRARGTQAVPRAAE